LETLQDDGDQMPERRGHAAIALGASDEIRRIRAALTAEEVISGVALKPDGRRRAYILDSIGHPAEVQLLQRVYGAAFTVVGVVCQEAERIRRLADKYPSAGRENARKFKERDARAPENHPGESPRAVAPRVRTADVPNQCFFSMGPCPHPRRSPFRRCCRHPPADGTCRQRTADRASAADGGHAVR
jgi:hypothetical protein